MCTVNRLGGNRFRVTYRGSGVFRFKCDATDSDGLKGTSSMAVTVVDLKGTKTCFNYVYFYEYI